MQAQRYRHRIEFQAKVETQDQGTGAISYAWQTAKLGTLPLSSVPASVLTGPGREFNAADTKQAETTARINCRWFPGLLPTWRILWDGRVYDITSIETDATARREWRMRCKDGVNDGG